MALLRRHWMLLIGLLPLACVAQPFSIDPHSEALFQKALPYLEQANAKLETIPANGPSASVEDKQKAMALAEAAGALLKSAMPLLQQAAALDHPVAQYRLALIYAMIQPLDGAPEKSCPLLVPSLKHGFAPSASMMSSWCPDFAQTQEYQAALANVATSQPLYARYYPQPAIVFECRGDAPKGLTMPEGDAKDFLAEVYVLQGDSNRAQRKTFYQQAIDLNDCYKAKRRMTRS